MKHGLVFILIFLITLTGCKGTSFTAQTITPPISFTPDAAKPLISSETPTATSIPSNAEKPTATQTITPTYDPHTERTITAVPAAVCPLVNGTYQPAFADQKVDGPWYLHDLSGPILEALNQGAGLPALKRAVSRAIFNGKPAEITPEEIFAIDVTGDGVPEIIFDHNWLIIYTCQSGLYREVLKWNSGLENFIEKPTIADMDLDGVAEIVAPTRFQANYVKEYYFEILKWNGTDFVNQIQNKDLAFNGNIEWAVRDTDRNGTLELVIRNWPPTSPDAELHGPWRYETSTLIWDGHTFTLLPMVLDPPEYRFQAVQDGDRAIKRQDYLSAVKFFKQAIEDPDLKEWGYSIEDFIQRQVAQSDQFKGTPTPTALPLDPNESLNLRAYARFRILLAHVMLNESEFAQTDYRALQNEYPAGKTGSVYALLGRLFWEQYQKEGNITTSCSKVTDYALKNEQSVLDPLNAYSLGFQNLSYEINGLCPY